MNPHKLESIIQKFGVRTSVVGDKVRCSCLLAPWTHAGGSDEKPSMVVFAHGREGIGPFYTCLGCHAKGSFRGLILFLWHKTKRNLFDVIEALDDDSDAIDLSGVPPKVANRMRSHRRTFSEGYESKVRKRAEMESGQPWVDERAIARSDEVSEIPWSFYAPYAGKVPEYALGRGLTMETCLEWELGDDQEMRRLLFPLRDRHGRLVCISGRLYEEKQCLWCGGEIKNIMMLGKKKEKRICSKCGRDVPPKYLHNDGFKRNLFLYGENRMEPGAAMGHVVEGHIDQLKMWQDGYRPVVATLGSGVGVEQVEKMVSMWRAIKTIGDGDKAGRDMNAMIKKMVAGRVPVFTVPIPEKRDPGDLTRAEKLDIIGPPTLTNVVI
jgi:hypothetical protein